MKHSDASGCRLGSLLFRVGMMNLNVRSEDGDEVAVRLEAVLVLYMYPIDTHTPLGNTVQDIRPVWRDPNRLCARVATLP